MDGVAGHSFGQELRCLYEEAGRPALDALVLLAHSELPASDRPTVDAVESWLRDEDIPASPAELKAFIGLLIHVAERVSDGTCTLRPLSWWESLWSASAQRREPAAGDPARTSATARPIGSPHSEPAVTAPPSPAVSHSPFPAPRQMNAVDGRARIDGPNIQAERIDGGVHFHEAPMAQAARGHTVGAADQGAGVVIRVRSGTETIEIYDEGLARYWISARLQLGPE